MTPQAASSFPSPQNRARLTGTSATVDGLQLDPAGRYAAFLEAMNFDTRDSNFTVPAPEYFSVSRTMRDFTLFQMIGGVRAQSGGNDTYFTYRFARPDGAPANVSVNFTVTGPAGWNGGQPFNAPDRFLGQDTDRMQRGWFGPAAPPVSGAYSFTAVIGPTTYSGSFTIDATQTLPEPASLTPITVTAGSVTCSWSAVVRAQSYDFDIWNDTDRRSEGSLQYVTGTTATVIGLTLTAAKTYFCQVSPQSINLTATAFAPLGTQNNTSFRRAQLTLP
ncbi:MAG: hypothetical protein SFU83_07180 [Meiothermus sp.]|nr:hypothetical protein [Meiothermus sp.]